MATLLSLYLPTWSIDLARRCRRKWTATQPLSTRQRSTFAVLLVTTVTGRQVVARYCRRAADVGVHVGMTLSHARALLPTEAVEVKPFNSRRDTAALHALAEWATRFVPRVATDDPDGLLMDATGCHRLYGSRKQLIRLLSDRVRRLGLQARIAAAPTFGCAWAIARFGSHTNAIVSADQVRRKLADLPVEALHLEATTCTALAEVGLTQIRHLFDLSRPQLAERFGNTLLLRLDQATGQAFQDIEPVCPVLPLCVRHAFVGPVKQLEVIQMTVRHLLVELVAQLHHREHGAQEIKLAVERSDADPVQISIHLSRPSRDSEHLWSLLGPKVERLNMGFGVQCMVLGAPCISALPHYQLEIRPGSETIDGGGYVFGQLLDTMIARLGVDRVTRAEPVATHIPEHAFHHCGAVNTVHRGAWDTPVAPPDRPPILFDPPQSIRAVAILSDGPPSQVLWHGHQHSIVASAGPERIGPQWWRAESGGGNQEDWMIQGTRDYFCVVDKQGQWLWVYRALESGQWFIHGLWS